MQSCRQPCNRVLGNQLSRKPQQVPRYVLYGQSDVTRRSSLSEPPSIAERQSHLARPVCLLYATHVWKTMDVPATLHKVSLIRDVPPPNSFCPAIQLFYSASWTICTGEFDANVAGNSSPKTEKKETWGRLTKPSAPGTGSAYYSVCHTMCSGDRSFGANIIVAERATKPTISPYDTWRG